MIRRKIAGVLLIIAGWLLISPSLFAQEIEQYKPIPVEMLRAVLADVKGWMDETIDFRENAKTLTIEELVQQAGDIRKKFDPVIVLMATTEPPDDYKLAATLLLMGTKGLELSLWHYILAGVTNTQIAIDHGDTLLQPAVDQIRDAEKLFDREAGASSP